jgi:hypothetical protein
MSVDDLLLAIIIGGMVLSGAYLRAQYAARRNYRMAERSNALLLRELYGTRSKTQDSAQGPDRRVPQATATRAPRNAASGALAPRNPVQELWRRVQNAVLEDERS